MNSISNKIERLINEAKSYLSEAQSLLTKLLQAKTDTEDDGSSDEDRMLKIQLTLQYRLSCEEALGFLLRLDHNLLYYLGIQPRQSAKTNIDRLAYAVGNEDLKQILNILAILAGSLSKIVARYKNTHNSFALRDRISQKHHGITKEFSRLLEKQNQFLKVLHKLDLEIEQIIKLQAGEPIFDYIAALRGPISHFHQAIMNGLEQGKQLYLQVNKTPLLDYQLNNLLSETQQVLHLMPSTYNHHPDYPTKQFDHPVTSEQLEHRAAAKRLRPFFG
jgi:DNA-directed RNA polymerase subunit H (RpoH/RPB5)